MALTICKECGKEVATTAAACPNCGNPINPVKKQTKTVITPTPVENEQPFPTWVIFPIIIVGALLIFLLYSMFSSNDETASDNVNINIGQDQIATRTIDNDAQKPVDTTIVEGDTDIPNTTTAPPPAPVNEQQIPPDTRTEVGENGSKDDKGKVMLDAKFADKNGKVQNVKDEKFYLLDKDLETILREANLQGIENQSLKNSFGLSVIDPGKYSEFNKKALDAINDHIKYDVLTNSDGKAEFGNVEPKSYYLFGIHKVGNGFAIWNSAVTVNKGENKLQIQPQRPTEIRR